MGGSTDRKDPLTVFQFSLSIKDLSVDEETAFFKSVSGLKIEMETSDYNEGGENGYTKKLLGRLKYPNIVLKNGFTGDLKFWNYLYKTSADDGTIKRFSCTIKHLGPGPTTKLTWTVTNAMVIKWEMGELDASKNELAIETIELVHEGLSVA